MKLAKIAPLLAALALVSLSPMMSGADTPKSPQSWWPVHTKRVWHYEGKLGAEGVAPKAIKYDVTGRDKETISGLDAYPLDTKVNGRRISTEWFAYDDTKVLLVKQSQTADTARLLEPPQIFLDVTQLDGEGKWSWRSKDGDESVDARFAGKESIKLAKLDERDHPCVIIESTIRFTVGEPDAKGVEQKKNYEQKRKLWLEPGYGLVHELSTTRGGEDHATELDVDLVKVEAAH